MHVMASYYYIKLCHTKKFPNILSRCHTKRRTGVRGATPGLLATDIHIQIQIILPMTISELCSD